MRFYLKKTAVCCLLLWAALSLPAAAKELSLRGAWVSSVYNLDYPSQPGLTADQLRQEADQIVRDAKAWGLNALFLQVRPCGDALYPSDIDPWSAYLSGAQGVPPEGNFDPLDYFIQICHEQGLELHAWLNPYRLTRRAADSREEAFALLSADHPARELEEWVVFHTDGCLYYDPGRPQVRDQIAASVEELLSRYQVDGIHLDDYFYPGGDFADEDTFADLGAGFATIGDFRRDAVDQLIRRLHRLVADKLPLGQFGVSPAGIWATADKMDMGVATIGGQTYFDQYADSRKWVREGMVDYIMPQLYWEIGAPAGDFSTLLSWWDRTVSDTRVSLYIGLAAYRSAEAQEGSVWYGPEEIQRQLDAIQASEYAQGAVFFRYGSLKSADLLPAEEEEPPAAPAPSVWPDRLTIDGPVCGQAVDSNGQLALSCTAPRGSRVTAFYGSSFQRLRPGQNGSYTGAISAETPYQQSSYVAPVLICAEKHGVLTLQLTPCTLASVRTGAPAAVEDIRWTQEESVHRVTFVTGSPCAAQAERVGDVLTLTIAPGRMGVLFQDDYFTRVELDQEEDSLRYRLILPDDGRRRQFSLIWAEESVTLLVEDDPPAPSAPDR